MMAAPRKHTASLLDTARLEQLLRSLDVAIGSAVHLWCWQFPLRQSRHASGCTCFKWPTSLHRIYKGYGVLIFIQS